MPLMLIRIDEYTERTLDIKGEIVLYVERNSRTDRI